MYNNFSLKQNMQIPQENLYNCRSVMNFDDEIERLSDSYEIHKPPEVKDFLKKNNELIAYINVITPMIDNHFPNYKKCLTFCQDPEYEELDDITICINSFKSEFDADWKKLDQLEKELFYITGFSTKIKGIMSVDLWLK